MDEGICIVQETAWECAEAEDASAEGIDSEEVMNTDFNWKKILCF